MSDFVQRQVIRAAGELGPAIRPRLPSLFEPMRPEAAGPEPLAVEAEVHAELPDVVSGATQLAPPMAHSRTPELQPAPARHAGGGAREARAGRSRAEARAESMPAPGPARRSFPPQAPTAPASAHQPSSATEDATGADVVPADELVSVTASRTSRTSRTPAPLTGTAAKLRGRPESRAQGPGHRPGAGPDPSGAAATLSWSVGTPDEGPLLVPTTTPASGGFRPRALSDLPSRDAAADATIEVTIGRIEVRATPAPSSPVPRRPARQSPTDLELYLRRKGAGRS